MDPLAQLNDIQTPSYVDWWPLAWGWWVAALLLLALTGLVISKVIQHIRFNRARKQAIAVNQSLLADQQYPAQANQLLKRVALHYFGPEATASVYGDQWLNLLLSVLSKKHCKQCSEELTLLVSHSYQPATLNQEQFISIKAAVGHWLQNANLKQVPELSAVPGDTNHV